MVARRRAKELWVRRKQVVVVVVEQAAAARGPRKRLLLRLERLLVVVDVRGHAPRVLGHLEVDVRHQLVVCHALYITFCCEENLEAVSQPLEDEVLDLEEEEADEGLNHRLGVDLAHLGVPGVERVALAVSRRAWSHLEEGEEVEVLGNGPERGRGGGRVLLEEGLHGLQVLVDDGEDGGEDAVDHAGRGRVQLIEVRICG